MNKDGYRKYVFDEENRKFIGEFDKMYIAEKDGNFDSWKQDDVHFLDKQICLQILKQYDFNSILDVGCGKGALTHLMKTENNSVIGCDISKKAVSIAGNRYPDIPFFSMDIQDADWKNYSLNIWEKMKSEGKVDCVTCLETLSYIEKWQGVIKDFSLIGRYVLLKLFIPDNPIGYVKNEDEFVSECNKYFDIVEYIEYISNQMIIIFGKRK